MAVPLDINLPADLPPLSLDEYIECIESRSYDLNEIDDLVDTAQYLKRLGNNRSLLTSWISQKLKHLDDFQKNNIYVPQVFMLHSCDRYFLRANVWKPVTLAERKIDNFRYDVCHDHNFHILTLGYFGPGYKSKTYVYDASNTLSLLGEEVNLKPTGTFTLAEGRVALYRAKKDVHRQLPPKSLSISINLIPRTPHIHQPQLQFDEKSRQIVRYLHASGSELMVRLAGVIGDKGFLEPLAKIAEQGEGDILKALASASMVKIDPTLYERELCRIERGSGSTTRRILDLETEKDGSSLKLRKIAYGLE